MNKLINFIKSIFVTYKPNVITEYPKYNVRYDVYTEGGKITYDECINNIRNDGWLIVAIIKENNVYHIVSNRY